ncbi:MAG TPA: carbamoyl-phosphate synthase (glutamine-hydrolyzing) large subunit [Spirochaetota bacterium]|nr:carbamoyl-phosphate synthase (glutamine-hydrolyzing) large subunit [Spirochaetota bacterium]
MPLYKDIKKALVIGSGPIVIGQAAEFDYAGTQACKSLREEGLEVVLVNSNPATIMTDLNMADKVYLEPLTIDSVERIIAKERPDGLLPTLGGQTGLNLAVELSENGVLDKYNVRLLGTPLMAMKKAEDRELFKNLMIEINEPIPPSAIVNTVKGAVDFAEEIGYPVIVRPAYTMGGLGGGIADNREDLVNISMKGIKNSRIGQLLIERSVAGWKEIEFEVMRDSGDACITICSMENVDPVGIHTGDSLVVAPCQTLADREYRMLRAASLKIIRALGIEGGCNIQFALDPYSFEYIVIEVNPRVSRSSALASKATGYPIAKVASKIAIGLRLDEIENSVTKKTLASFEPAIDYVVTKAPRWPFDKFVSADRSLGAQMKATGEVMAIDRSLEGSLMKAIRSLEMRVDGPYLKSIADWDDAKLVEYLKLVDDRRMFVIFELLRRGYPIGKIASDTKIDMFFLKKFENIILLEKEIKNYFTKETVLSGKKPEEKVIAFLRKIKDRGFADTYIARMMGTTHLEFRAFRKLCGVIPVYKMVDTCAAEFEAHTPYYYSTYEEEDEVVVNDKRKILVLGSGPIRIGQGIEFDYCSVHSVWGLAEEGIESIIINNNPETVSTDFDASDKLYFEPLNIEDILNVIDKENPEGVIVQFGGQTAINLVKPLYDAGIKILGTSIDSIDIAEDRKRFNDLLHSLGALQPEGKSVVSFDEALGVANRLGYPLLVRPSYVIGGHAMEIVNNDDDLFQYMRFATDISPEHPVLVDRYVLGKEAEVDVICDGEDVFIPGIFEQIERAGVHSGDSMAVFPPFNLTEDEKSTIIKNTVAIGRALKVVGLMNIQYVIKGGKVYCIEVNPRASRTVPIISKVTGIGMVSIATRIMTGKKLKDFGYSTGLLTPPDFYTIKAPVFSFDKLKLVETSLGPEMKSTGEVLGLGFKKVNALFKAMSASGINIPKAGNALISIANRDKEELFDLAQRLLNLGYKLYGTKETYKFLADKGIEINPAYLPGDGVPNVIELMKDNVIDLIINTPTKGKNPGKLGFKIRRLAVELRTPCITSLDTAISAITVLEEEKKGNDLRANSLNDLLETYKDKSIIY